MNETTTRLLKKFQDEEYRYAYDEAFSYSRMATQIQAIRESQNLKQKELADLAGMRQTRISELENVNYSMWTVATLRRLAQALGVRFSFKFESWGELLPDIEFGGREYLVRPRFEKDPAFSAEEILGKRKKRKQTNRAVSHSQTPYLSFMYPMDTSRTAGASTKSEAAQAAQTDNSEIVTKLASNNVVEIRFGKAA